MHKYYRKLLNFPYAALLPFNSVSFYSKVVACLMMHVQYHFTSVAGITEVFAYTLACA